MLAMSFIHAGPRGMQASAEAARGIEFEEKPANPGNYPEGWAADIGAFRSGIDYSTVDLTADEKAKLYDWYLRTIGEIPPYVRFMAEHRPRLLKTHRSEEHTSELQSLMRLSYDVFCSKKQNIP